MKFVIVCKISEFIFGIIKKTKTKFDNADKRIYEKRFYQYIHICMHLNWANWQKKNY